MSTKDNVNSKARGVHEMISLILSLFFSKSSLYNHLNDLNNPATATRMNGVNINNCVSVMRCTYVV